MTPVSAPAGPANGEGGIGRKLREAREKRGVSLRQVAHQTKISMTVLEALERNDLSRLPGGIFSRGFVRSYALEVGLDADQIVQEFIDQFPADSVTAGHPVSHRTEADELHESDRRMATAFFKLVVWSVPLALLVIYFGAPGRTPARAVVGTSPARAEVPVPPPAPAPAVAPPAAGEAVGAATGGSAAVDRLTVAIAAVAPCRVTAVVDGQQVFDRELQAGEREIVEVQSELELTTTDGAALTLMLNGAEARALGGRGQLVTVTLTPANFREYLPVP
jgi:transcriptional regulator with XRE-family HTH domain